jgi:hypothetical protein
VYEAHDKMRHIMTPFKTVHHLAPS